MSLTKKISISFISRILSFTAAFAISVVVSRNFGPELYGTYRYILLLVSTSYLFSNIGFFQSQNQLLARKKTNKDIVFFLNTIWSILLFLLIFGALIVYLKFKELGFLKLNTMVISLIYLFLFIQNSSVSLIISGLHKINQFNIMNTLKVLILLIFIVIQIQLNKFNLEVLLYGQILVSIIYFIIALIIIRPSGTIKELVGSINGKLLKNIFKRGLIIQISNLSAFLNYRLDMFLIKFFNNFSSLGIYSIAVQLVEKLWILPQSIRNIIFLEIAGKRKDERFVCIICRITLFVLFLVSILIGLFSFKLIPLIYSIKYVDSIIPFILLLPGVLFFTLSKIISSYFLGIDKIYINTISSVTSFIVNLIMNILLIPKYGIIGASIATSVSYSIGAIIELRYFIIETKCTIKDIIFIQKSDFTLLKLNIMKLIVKK
ncbi:MAG: polysaccharide biosynthesis C-terminal domain-containing protein [Candidatus Cloacimonetes bacterium]|nr:polysaccharide biosynthesis C-terminal domain-containing protein [Candidatus Cloacimonadota bacterium]